MTYALHDQLLKSLSGTAPELRNGAPNHAPMVVEALAALGRDDDAVEWLEGNRFRLKEISDVGETGLGATRGVQRRGVGRPATG